MDWKSFYSTNGFVVARGAIEVSIGKIQDMAMILIII